MTGRDDDQTFRISDVREAILIDGGPIPARLQPELPVVDAYWQEKRAQMPELFNGRVFVLTDYVVSHDRLAGRISAIEFKTFLYLRDIAWPDKLHDVFGSAVVMSSEGHVVLGTASEKTINAGWSYFFGGFIDPSDIAEAGVADLEAHTARELVEETGLEVGRELAAEPGYILATSTHQMSICVLYRSALGTDQLIERISRFIKRSGEAELSGVRVIRDSADFDDGRTKRYTVDVLEHIWRTR